MMASHPSAPAGQPIPVTLVTGFLGSGKTTLINAVLRSPAFAGAMVIVNEFGEVGLDHLLVSSAQDQVVLLDSGCLCCAASGSLRDTLIDLFARRAGGSVPAFDRIIVETSGLAHPGPLVASLIGDSALASRCALAQVLTLVDAHNGAATLARYAEARHQVAFADRLAVSKTDAAEPAEVQALAQALAGMNADAPVLRWHRGLPAGPLFAGGGGADAAVAQRPEVWLRNLLRARQGGGDEDAGDARDAAAGGVLRNIHDPAFRRIAAHVLRFGPQPIGWADYAHWTRTLAARFGKRLLRCKGLLPLGEDGRPSVVQGVQGYFAPPQPLAAWPAGQTGGFLVCIGEGIGRPELEAIVGQTAVSPLAGRPGASEPAGHRSSFPAD